MSQNDLFGIEDLRKAGIEESLESKIVSCHINESILQRHSLTGYATLELEKGTEKKIFFKRHIAKKKDSAEIECLRNFHLREGTYLDVINEEIVNREKEINSPLVPRLLGRLTDNNNLIFYLFADFLGEVSAEQKYLSLAGELRRAEEEGNQQKIGLLREQKLSLLRDDLKAIARFDGLCNSHELEFPSYLEKHMREVHQTQLEKLPQYLGL